jgi:aldehyde:ferredoxin oxidoreductase
MARALEVDLEALERGSGARAVELVTLPDDEPGWRALAQLGGSALGLACLHAHARRDPARSGPFVVAVGEAVRRGLPTAARAAVLARAPLSGLYAEGHVGGELGARLARVADALVLVGRATRPGAVLVLGEAGELELCSRPVLRGAAAAETARALERELGPCAVLAVGPAGEAGLAFANLGAGHAPPSFVGRGGLGAAFAAHGLKALCVRAQPLAAELGAREQALVRRLARSPRLAARAAGGTLELFAAAAARGELARGRALASEAKERASARHGCRGCPTPCGWVFERSDGAPQGARFGAAQALGPALGLATLDDALALLARCDELGLDAKEAGAVLALVGEGVARGRLAGPDPRGSRLELARRLAALVADAHAPGRDGAAALARELGLEEAVASARGQAVRAEAERAALLGQCVAAGGADPMRSFPFLLESAAHARLAELLAPLPVPRAALDPAVGTAKGRLVFWHENLVSAADLAGFCAFSAAGLLADGLATLDELAEWILPAALAEPADPAWAARTPATRLLAAGASLALARHALNARYGLAVEAARPPFARARLDEPGMLDEYRALRGLDGDGRPSAAALERLATPALLELGLGTLAPEPTAGAVEIEAAPPRSRAPGRVVVRASGPLAALLGARRELELVLPCSTTETLRVLAQGDARAAAGLFAGKQLVPAVWRRGRRLAPEDAVASGDELELVTAIPGG